MKDEKKKTTDALRRQDTRHGQWPRSINANETAVSRVQRQGLGLFSFGWAPEGRSLFTGARLVTPNDMTCVAVLALRSTA